SFLDNATGTIVEGVLSGKEVPGPFSSAPARLQGSKALSNPTASSLDIPTPTDITVAYLAGGYDSTKRSGNSVDMAA
ncbi:MAG: hypothetical protein K2Q10_05040, partial [Rhodospirillales bacterium]|nr:hypothetical protein [Rhodospirillales bacterium]